MQWAPVAFFRFAIFFLAGTAAGIFLPHPRLHIPLVTLVCTIVYVTAYVITRKSSWSSALLGGIGLSLLFLIGWANVHYFEKRAHVELSAAPQSYHYVQVRVLEPPLEKEKSWKVLLEIQAGYNGQEWTSERTRSLAYFAKSDSTPPCSYGDLLLLTGRIQNIPSPANPAEFDYRQFMANRGVFYQMYVPLESAQVVSTGNTTFLFRWAYKTRTWAQDQLAKIIPSERERKILSALSLGIKSDLDNDIKKAYASSGAMHVLAVSGLHVGILFLFLNVLLAPLKRIPKGEVLQLILLISLLWGYALITGLSPSIQRATLMFTVMAAGKISQRPVNVYNSLGVAALLMVLLDPFILVEVGFQLSFLAVLGIVAIYPTIESWVRVKHAVPRFFWQITCVSIAAQFATFPLGLLYFHQFPNLFLLANVVVIPMAFTLFIGALLGIGFSFLPSVAALIGRVVGRLTHWLNEVIFGLESIPFALTKGISISTLETWAIYGIIVSLLSFWRWKRFFPLYATMGCSLLLGGSQLREAIQHTSQEALVVYSIKNHCAMDFIQGTKHTFISDTSLVSDQLDYHIKPFWWQMGLESPQATSLNTLKKKAQKSLDSTTVLIVWNERSLLFTDSPSAHASLGVDLMVVTSGNKIPFIPREVAAKTLVFDGTFTYRKQQIVEQYGRNYLDRCHFVLKDGAYLLHL